MIQMRYKALAMNRSSDFLIVSVVGLIIYS